MSRILLVPDVRGWAWWNMAQGLRRCVIDVDCHVVTQEQFAVFTQECTHLLSGFDAILQYSWTEATHNKRIQRNCALLASHGAEYHYPPTGDTFPEKIATKLRNRERAYGDLKKFDKVLCVSSKLRETATELGGNAITTLPGVDHAVFFPIDRPAGKSITVGWCGQSHGETKGYHEILVPLMQLGIPGIRWEVNSRTAENPLSPDEMREWYAGIDVLLCTSCSEGSPMPPYEAMACGRPVISTDVGSMAQLITPETGWIVPSWKTLEDAEAVTDIIADRLQSLSGLKGKGEAARQRVLDEFTWQKMAPNWLEAILP